MNKPDLKSTIQFIIALVLVAGIGGLLLHELGHGLTAEVLGGEFTSLHVWPGVQLWPNPGLPFDGEWPGYVGLAGYSYGSDWKTPGWQTGLVTLMGSGLSLIFAGLALLDLYIFRPRGMLSYFFIAASLLYLDMTLYTYLPLIGLRHFFFLGGSTPEPLEGALDMGIPAFAFLLGVTAITTLMTWLLIRYLRQKPTTP